MASSFGTKLYYSTNGTDYTELAEVIDGDFPDIDHRTYEDKHLGQADRWVPKKGAFVDGGMARFRIRYAKAKKTVLMGFVDDEDPIDWRIIVPDGANEAGSSKVEFKALLKKVGMAFEEDGGRLVNMIELEVSGAVTFTAGA